VSRRAAYILFAACCLAWGGSYAAYRTLAQDLSTPAIAVLDAGAAGAVLLAVLACRRDWRILEARLWPRILGLAVIERVVPTLCLAFAAARADSLVLALIASALPVFTGLLEAVLGVPHRLRLLLAAAALGAGGTALLSGGGDGGPLDLAAVAAVAAATAGYAVGAVLSPQVVRRTGSLGLITAEVLITLVVSLALAAASGAAIRLPATTGGWLAILWLGVAVSALAGAGTYRLILVIGATGYALSAYAVPLIALVIGVTVMGEPLGPLTLLAAILLIGGTALGMRSTASPAPQGPDRRAATPPD
jgi:drug/metabolite transporter (DMT)-like permease